MALNNSQYNKILKEYDAKQFAIKKQIDTRTKEVYSKIKGFKQLDDEIILNSMNCAKFTLSVEENIDVDKEINKLSDANNDLSMRKIELLKENGYPADYLKPQYECSKCKDTGFIDNKPCKCFIQSAIKLLYSQDLVNKSLNKENFTTFDYNLYSKKKSSSDDVSPRENIEEVVEKTYTFIQDYDKEYNKRKYKNLLIYGTTGVGKTFLTNCIAKELLDRSFSVIYLTAADFFSILEKSFFDKSNIDAVEKTEYIYTCDLLIIDDLGTELNTTLTSSQLYSCINGRMLKELSTIISTNLTLKEIHTNYNERISSRLFGEYQPLRIIASDIRWTK